MQQMVIRQALMMHYHPGFLENEAYKDGKLICFFQSADKWGTRYSTLGFDANAKLDDGSMWPTSFALTKLTPANSKAIAALVKKAIGKK